MKDIHVAVTGINATDNPGPGTGVIRSLRHSSDFDGKIIGLAYDVMDPGIYLSDLVNVSYMIPYPSQEPKVLLDRIAYIHSIEHIDVLIPTLDAELLNFIKIEPELKKMGIHMFLPTKKCFELRSKNLLADFCQKNEIAVPKTHSISTLDELYKLDIQYPVYVKGIFYDAYMAYSVAQAASAFNNIAYKWGVPVIVQEFVQGEEFDVVALGDEGTTIGAVAMRKMSLTDKKKAWAGITIENTELIELTHKLIKALKWRGPMEAEIMLDRSGELYLIEINPRFPAWCFLAPGAGQNLAQALVRLALGEKVEPFVAYEVGKLFVRYSAEVLADIKDIEKLTTSGTLELRGA